MIEEAESGIDCLRRVPIFPAEPDFMDLNMPLMGGWKQHDYCVKNNITNVPILIISANAESVKSILDAVLSKTLCSNQSISICC
ncbi:hypothetical protein ABVN80_16580 [Acinetobacter baumannii]